LPGAAGHRLGPRRQNLDKFFITLWQHWAQTTHQISARFKLGHSFFTGIPRAGWDNSLEGGKSVSSCRLQTGVFIIGGGPAGLATAIAARQHGLAVTVADGAAPPIDKACGEGLLPETLAMLAELGVEIPLVTGYPLRGIRFLQHDAQVSAEFSAGQALGIRRTVLHARLITRAEQCGVQLLWRTPVTGISAAGVHVSGGFVPARWIVGADGSGSRVRRWAGLDRAVRAKQRFAARRHYRIAPWADYAEIYWGPRAQAYVTPIHNEEVCVVVLAEQVEEADFDPFLSDCPQLAARLDGAGLSSRERGAVTLMHSLASVHSANVALVGDASGGVDAITGEGLRLAFRQALALASAIEQGDLRSYAQAHRALARKPMFIGDLLLMHGKSERLRTRSLRMLAEKPQLFARLLALHSADAAWEDVLAAGAQFGWRFLVA
jgi:flavin-dependent dehydrogenase